MNLYQTQNRALAITLATCGVPFASDEDGKTRPFIHIYDAAVLRKLGYKGWKVEDAARDAWKRGKAGLVVYCFRRNALLERILKAYDKQSKALTSDEQGTMAESMPGATFPDLNPEHMAMICCQIFKNRKVMSEGWRSATPFLAMHGENRQETDGAGRKVTIGSFKLISLAATPGARRAVGIPAL